jgi:hypothetical protein
VGKIKTPDRLTSPSNAIAPDKPTSGTKGAATRLSGASPGKKNETAGIYSDPTISGKKGKKAKKAKKNKKGKKGKNAPY